MVLDIIAIVISVIALGVSAFFTFWNSRPHIKIEYFGGIYDKETKRLLIAISYYNASPIAGCIKDSYIHYNYKDIYCIQQNEDFNLKGIYLKSKTYHSISLPETSLRLPISVEPFCCGIGVFVFPMDNDTPPPISFNLYYSLVGNKRFKHIHLERIDI